MLWILTSSILVCKENVILFIFQMLFLRINASYKLHLKKQLSHLNVINDGGPQNGYGFNITVPHTPIMNFLKIVMFVIVYAIFSTTILGTTIVKSAAFFFPSPYFVEMMSI